MAAADQFIGAARRDDDDHYIDEGMFQLCSARSLGFTVERAHLPRGDWFVGARAGVGQTRRSRRSSWGKALTSSVSRHLQGLGLDARRGRARAKLSVVKFGGARAWGRRRRAARRGGPQGLRLRAAARRDGRFRRGDGEHVRPEVVVEAERRRGAGRGQRQAPQEGVAASVGIIGATAGPRPCSDLGGSQSWSLRRHARTMPSNWRFEYLRVEVGRRRVVARVAAFFLRHHS